MSLTIRAKREILRKAKRIFVDFKNIDDEELIRCYILCNDTFAVNNMELSDDDTARLICGKVRQIVEELPYQARTYIKYRYGFFNGEYYTLEETADLMQINVCRMPNIRALALKQFRTKSKYIFIMNVIEQLELEIKANKEHIVSLKNQIRDMRENSVILHEDSIDSLNLSVRAYNLLKRNGISTIEQLRLLSYESISNWRGAGRVSINEILDMQKKLSKI